LAVTALLPSCVATTAPTVSSTSTAAVKPARVHKVKTTAYTHNEGSGSRNAIGKPLSRAAVKSAASDWSRYPLGTRFRVVGSDQEYVIDDYGGALIGTNTIDLYKPSHLEMRRWGVRHVDIEVIQWGSEAESLKVLRPRKGAPIVRRMIAGLEKKQQESLPTEQSPSGGGGGIFSNAAR
jgi:3D (Asp-Asp-Asp) domain-containing protein